MEDVRRPSYYKSYERKPQSVEDDAPNLYSVYRSFIEGYECHVQQYYISFIITLLLTRVGESLHGSCFHNLDEIGISG